MLNTIVAISSGIINQPISIIRMSGPDSFKIIKKIFIGKVGKDKSFTFGKIKDKDRVIDEVLVAWFKGPNTFTGEDIVEVNAHGGIINSQNILRLLLDNGATMAEPGEFSRRAFLNGKMDLVKAESIHDLIFAKTDKQAELAVKQFDGKTSKLIKSLQDEILNIIATCETNIDYPEYEDIKVLTNKNLLPSLESIKLKLENIISSSESSRYIFDGISVAIVGKPNSGKSSLLNALLRKDKALVSSIPGTTRDVVEGEFVINDLLLKLKDTAGIGEFNNELDQMGVNKSLDTIKDSDLVIHLIDPEDNNPLDIKSKLGSKTKYLKVFSKSDIIKKEGVSISSINEDIDQLIDATKELFNDIDIDNTEFIQNTKQLSLMRKSLSSINDAIKGLNNDLTPDTVIVDIQQSWDHLANILGKADHEDLLDNMFSNFCLGK